MLSFEPMASRLKMDNSSVTSAPIQTLDVLTSRLNSLSVEERDEALHDLHGVADENKETPKFIKTKTEEITNALLSLIADLKAGESEAFRKAMILSPKYVEKMKIVFLRSEGFRVQDAASRMIRFFTLKKELFGEGKLVQDITQKDLGEEEQQVLRKGVMHLLPHRDRAGRAIIMVNGQVNSSYLEHDTGVRVIFYFAMTILQEEENQIKGLVAIWHAICQTKIVHGRFPRIVEMSRALPWRLVGRHLCRETNSQFEPLFRYFIRSSESRFLFRFRYHSGTSMECIYSLMTFGIPREALPISEDGSIDDTDHYRVVRAMQYREEKDPSSDLPDAKVFVLGPMDVLMGRGRQPKSRPGLLRMHQLLVDYQETYDAASRLKKVDVAKAVILDMRDYGCRFLKPARGGYEECDESEIIAKISHGFRNLRMKTKKKEENEKTGTKKRSLETPS